ncbi:SHOCT domain-containing protein [Methanobacterium sp.]|uniref:SHOCT domain-containing protein n=1 Tax=Methanobacterium sp. TaxID=2164 RepID=UPI003D64E33C
MFETWVWKCIHMKCENTENGKEGQYCPECGKILHKVDSKEAKKINIKKAKYKSDPNWLRKEGLKRQKSVRVANIIAPLTGYDKESRSNVVVIPEKEGLKFNRKGIFMRGSRGEQFVRYADIISIGYGKKGLVLGNVTIMTPGGKIKIKNVPPKEGNRFVSGIQQKIMGVKSKANEYNTTQKQISPMDEINKAKKLLDNGIITEEEFNKIKNKYINY